MKFAFSSNAFRSYSLIDTIRILAEIGYQGIEIMADRPHAYPPDLSGSSMGEIRKVLSGCGMTISNINAFMLHALGDTYHPSWIEADAVERGKRIEYTRRCIDLTAELGASALSTEPGGPLDGMSRQEARLHFREGLLAVEQHAASSGIRILIEPEPELLIETSGQFVEFYKSLNSAVFGLNFDIGHFFCVGEVPENLVHELKSVTGHYHIEDIADTKVHRHLMLGDGAIALDSVLNEIDKTGYDGFVTVELYPYEDKPIATAKEAFAYLSAWQRNRY